MASRQESSQWPTLQPEQLLGFLQATQEFGVRLDLGMYKAPFLFFLQFSKVSHDCFVDLIAQRGGCLWGLLRRGHLNPKPSIFCRIQRWGLGPAHSQVLKKAISLEKMWMFAQWLANTLPAKDRHVPTFKFPKQYDASYIDCYRVGAVPNLYSTS